MSQYIFNMSLGYRVGCRGSIYFQVKAIGFQKIINNPG